MTDHVLLAVSACSLYTVHISYATAPYIICDWCIYYNATAPYIICDWCIYYMRLVHLLYATAPYIL